MSQPTVYLVTKSEHTCQICHLIWCFFVNDELVPTKSILISLILTYWLWRSKVTGNKWWLFGLYPGYLNCSVGVFVSQQVHPRVANMHETLPGRNTTETCGRKLPRIHDTCTKKNLARFVRWEGLPWASPPGSCRPCCPPCCQRRQAWHPGRAVAARWWRGGTLLEGEIDPLRHSL